VHHGDNPKRLFLRRIGNQVLTYRNEEQGTFREVRAFVALIGKGSHGANSAKDLSRTRRAASGLFSRDVLPNFGNVPRRMRMKPKARLCSH
jgi:hypothetical protein